MDNGIYHRNLLSNLFIYVLPCSFFTSFSLRYLARWMAYNSKIAKLGGLGDIVYLHSIHDTSRFQSSNSVLIHPIPSHPNPVFLSSYLSLLLTASFTYTSWRRPSPPFNQPSKTSRARLPRKTHKADFGLKVGLAKRSSCLRFGRVFWMAGRGKGIYPFPPHISLRLPRPAFTVRRS